MSDLPQNLLRFGDLATSRPTPFAWEPTAEERASIAGALDLSALRKLRLDGAVTPQGPQDWALTARLGATVVQPCVATLDPVTTRIEEDIARTYLADFPDPEAGEVEMPEDDAAEPLPAQIDLVAIAIEALSLALPAFPRSADAPPQDLTVAAPGVTPMTDEDARPFAGLAALRDKLQGD